MKFEIKNRFSGEIIFTIETDSWRLAIEAAIKAGANLSRADLSRADLSGADLSGADLSGADLSEANLSGANLSEANLSGSDLSRANLSEANLSEANLSGANLSEANLSEANLSEANLSEANLSGANLSGSDLSRAYLSGADLSGSDLSRAYLSGADLSGSDLSRANLSEANLSEDQLTQFRDDIWAVLSSSPKEVKGLRQALIDGKVDGSTYKGECACLVGTIANVAQKNYDQLPNLKPNSSRPAELFFALIKEGDNPESSRWSRMALGWVDQWIDNMESAFGVGI